MHFCPTCGTTVFWDADVRPDGIGVAVDAFHDANFPPPTLSVWEESKHGWVAFTHDVSHFAHGRPTSPSGLCGLEPGATTYGPQKETEPGGELGRVLINASGPDVRFRGGNRTSQNHVESVENDPQRTSCWASDVHALTTRLHTPPHAVLQILSIN